MRRPPASGNHEDEAYADSFQLQARLVVGGGMRRAISARVEPSVKNKSVMVSRQRRPRFPLGLPSRQTFASKVGWGDNSRVHYISSSVSSWPARSSETGWD